MLIKFQSNAAASFTMLADDAKPLLKNMGQAGKLEGSVSGSNLSDALTQLEAALAAEALAPITEIQVSEEIDPDEKPPVDISIRAGPLLDMLRKAQSGDTYTMWRPD